MGNELEKISIMLNTIEELMYTLLDFIDGDINEEEIEFVHYQMLRNAKQATRISNGVIELLKGSEENLSKLISKELKAKAGAQKCT